MNLNNIKDFVKSKLLNEASGHDYLHSLRVLENARNLVMYYNVNNDVVYISCLIHDLIDPKLDDVFKSTLDEIEDLLILEKVKTEDIIAVIDIINNISYSKGNIPNSLEGKIVQDADRLDALGAIGIARTFAFGGKKNRLIYNPESSDSTDSVSHFYQKLLKLETLMNTEQALIEAVKRTKYMKDFLNKLYGEIGSINL